MISFNLQLQENGKSFGVLESMFNQANWFYEFNGDSIRGWYQNKLDTDTIEIWYPAVFDHHYWAVEFHPKGNPTNIYCYMEAIRKDSLSIFIDGYDGGQLKMVRAASPN